MKTTNNLQSLEKLVGICTGLGEKYKPGNQKLQVEAMTTLLSQAQTTLSQLNEARTAVENATNNRADEFKKLRSLSTRLHGALIASGASAQTIEDANGMIRKLGKRSIHRAPVATAATTSTVAPASTATDASAKRRARGTGYHSVPGSFEKLIDTLSAETTYQPNETDLQVAQLKGRLSDLRAINSNVIQANEALRQTRMQRDKVFYQQDGNVCQVGQLAKQYVKSVYGFSSADHKAALKLRFKNKT